MCSGLNNTVCDVVKWSDSKSLVGRCSLCQCCVHINEGGLVVFRRGGKGSGDQYVMQGFEGSRIGRLYYRM